MTDDPDAGARDAPGTPGAPGDPGTPSAPGTHGDPGTPDAPGTPGPPSDPGAAGTPGTPAAADDARPASGALSGRAEAVLALERRNWAGPGAKERAVREELGLAPVRYYQILNALLDDERALAHDPVTVNRLRRVREARRAER
ncbi:DUF3263 domain-containing protein [Streptomyces sp. NPDC017941]|uniref:DUF3263 domain-containing protein n=1 Tax=Streptomyces sp. NPDC017941 TaxID=3365018 RepID=UPI0037BDFD9A